MEKITSSQNKRIKELLKLAKPRERHKQGLIVIDGLRAIKEAVKANFIINEIFYCPEIAKSQWLNLKNFSTCELAKNLFLKISYAENPDGYLAIAEPRQLGLDQVKLSDKPLILVLEALEKPGNLGAILRTAYAAKVDLIIINDPKTDIYNPNVVRASEGFIFDHQLVVADAKSTREFLKSHHIKTFATSLKARKNYVAADFKEACAIVFGAESSGLGAAWLKAADEQIKIPMREDMDSLNVSVSAAIILFEAWRQRGFN